MLKVKSLLEYTNLFRPNVYTKNGKMILKYLKLNINNLKQWEAIEMFVINIENLKTLKLLYIFKIH